MKNKRNEIKGIDCMQCPKCGAPMPIFANECMANDCDYKNGEIIQ